MQRSVFDYASLDNRLDVLEQEMQSPDIWSDKDKVSKLGAEIKELKENKSLIERWQGQLDDAAVSLEISDSDLINESYNSLIQIEKELDKFEIRLMLSGEYDEADAILTINAGAGGTDAQDWASMLLRMYMRWAESKGRESCMPSHVLRRS